MQPDFSSTESIVLGSLVSFYFFVSRTPYHWALRIFPFIAPLLPLSQYLSQLFFCSVLGINLFSLLTFALVGLGAFESLRVLVRRSKRIESSDIAMVVQGLSVNYVVVPLYHFIVYCFFPEGIFSIGQILGALGPTGTTMNAFCIMNGGSAEVSFAIQSIGFLLGLIVYKYYMQYLVGLELNDQVLFFSKSLQIFLGSFSVATFAYIGYQAVDVYFRNFLRCSQPEVSRSKEQYSAILKEISNTLGFLVMTIFLHDFSSSLSYFVNSFGLFYSLAFCLVMVGRFFVIPFLILTFSKRRFGSENSIALSLSILRSDSVGKILLPSFFPDAQLLITYNYCLTITQVFQYLLLTSYRFLFIPKEE